MRTLTCLGVLCAASIASADPAVIEAVDAQSTGSSWSFSVTLKHGDTGWDDYADGWRVEDSAGEILGTRELLHPHVNEQPFTRTLDGVEIPAGVTRVFIRARTNTDGWDEETTLFRLPG